MKKKILFINLFLLTFGITNAQTPDENGIIYVKQNATGMGSSWTDAYGNLQEAIDADDVKEVWVASGEYQPDIGEYFSMKANVKIYGGFPNTGTPGMANRNWENYSTTLRGNEECVMVNEGNGLTPSNSLLDGFTLTGGDTEYDGGGMYNNNSSPTLINLIISGNVTLMSGGGIYNDNSSPTLTNVTISGNKAEDSGGGMYNYDSSPTLTNVTINENKAVDDGGGMYNYYSFPLLTNVTINENTAVDDGGGIYNDNFSSPTLTNVIISGNTAKYGGGGMYNYDSSPTLTDVVITGDTAEYGGGMYNYGSFPILTDVTISGNTAAIVGGGMYNSSSSPTLTDVTISGNTAEHGGGMLNDNSSPTLTDVTISGNTAEHGGGMLNGNSSPLLTNVIISKNTAKDGGGILNGGSDLTLVNVLISENAADSLGGGIYNIESYLLLTNVTISGNAAVHQGGGMFNDEVEVKLYNSIVLGNTSGIEGDPIEESSSHNLIQTGDANSSAELDGVTADNSTPNDVFMGSTTGDYSLLNVPTNPAFNAGKNNLYVGGLFDLAGNPRLSQGNIDLGAYEIQSLLSVPTHTLAGAVRLYPNPTSGNINLVAEQNINKITVYDLAGGQVAMVYPNNQTAQVDVSHLQAAVYFVHVETAGNLQIVKIIKK